MKSIALNNNSLAKIFMAAIFTIFLSSTHLVEEARAAEPNEIVKVMCNVIGQLTGGIGKTIAIIVVISLAIALFLGKVSWGIAIAVAVGMGILFGANDVVTLIGGGEDPCQAINP